MKVNKGHYVDFKGHYVDFVTNMITLKISCLKGNLIAKKIKGIM